MYKKRAIMNEEKIPFIRCELSVNKFNEVAIPHHLGLLKNHKSNIEKCLALGDWTKMKKEEINAIRVIKQLKNLLMEMESLREKINDDEVKKFDNIINIGKKAALEGIKDYMDLQLKSPTSTIKSNSDEDSPIAVLENDLNECLPQIQADFQAEQHQLQARQACLNEFENLQREVTDLHSMFNNIHELVHEQGESVVIIADNAEEALENVQQGETQLRQALKYKKAMYPVMGAVLGTCVGGPIGLIAGIKAGGLAAIGCGILGFTGGSVLKSGDVANGIEMEKKDE